MNPSPPIDQPSSAALRILCAGAMHPILDALTGAIARIAGGPVMVRYASSGGVKARVLEGEPADVVITTAAAIDHLGDHDPGGNRDSGGAVVHRRRRARRCGTA
jgi:ABC-type molybdate transport system substrate-binding protein